MKNQFTIPAALFGEVFLIAGMVTIAIGSEMPDPVDDLVVCCDSSGAVTAAVTAKRQGRSGILVCEGKRSAPDSVGLGSFGMDSHVVPHFVIESGHAQNDGVIWRVPVCVSASHVAHGSIRMEPVLMTFWQSAAIVAGMAIDNNASGQEVFYPELREKPGAANQIKILPPGKTKAATAMRVKRHNPSTVEDVPVGEERAGPGQ